MDHRRPAIPHARTSTSHLPPLYQRTCPRHRRGPDPLVPHANPSARAFICIYSLIAPSSLCPERTWPSELPHLCASIGQNHTTIVLFCILSIYDKLACQRL